MNSSIREKYVTELKDLFHAQGVQLYSGQHSLCLTTACLHFLQKKFTSLHDNPSNNTSLQFSDLQYIHDCLCKIISLKLICDRKYTVAPSLVNLDLSTFRALQSLVLKRVPISSLTGLQRLRQQLRVLVIQRSNLNSLEDVLIKCGGDEARAFAWTNLKELDLSVNTIKELGEPLRYLPEVEQVNISSNQIGSGSLIESGSISSSINSTDREEGLLAVSGIQFIDKVKRLHLGFNQLTCVPEFAGRAKYNLTVLVLRNNMLRDVRGVEVLDSLVELDVCENLISKHSNLAPLLNLHHLNLLSIMGNPLCYDVKYRVKTVQCLSNLISPTTFLLDGKKLSTTEKKNISRSLTHYSPPTTTHSTPSPSTSPLRSVNHLTIPQLTGGSTTPVLLSPIRALSIPSPDVNIVKHNVGGDTNDFDDILKPQSLPSKISKSSRSSKRGSLKKKTRVVAFEEDSPFHADSSEEMSNSSTNIPLLNEERMTKHEDLRMLLRENWLSTAESGSYSGDGMETSGERQSSKLKPSKQKSQLPHTATEINKDEVSVPVSSGLTSIPVINNDNQSESISSGPVNDLLSIPNATVTVSKADSHSVKDMRLSPINISDENDDNSSIDDNVITDQSHHSPVGLPKEALTSSSPQEPMLKIKEAQNDNKIDMFAMELDEDNRPLDQSSPEPNKGLTPQVTGSIFDVSVFDSDTDEERQSDLSVWISISDKFLQEISCEGTVQDQLDLQCLKSAEIEKRHCKGEEKQVLVLHFSYDRRDRRKREYVLNDQTDQEKMLEQLKPIVDINASAVSIAAKLECFKCQTVIDWSEAIDAPGDSPAAVGFHSTSLDMNNRLSSLGKVCPRCNGFLIQISGSGTTSTSVPLRSSYTNTSPQSLRRPSAETATKSRKELSTLSNDDSEISESGLFSPGHIDISAFASYPDSHQNSGEYPNPYTPLVLRLSPVPPSPIDPLTTRLSPVPPSPYPDMSPFHTPLKPQQTSLKRDEDFVLENSQDFEQVNDENEGTYNETDNRGSLTTNKEISDGNAAAARTSYTTLPLENVSLVTEDNYRGFGTTSEPNQLSFQHGFLSTNPFDIADDPASSNPFNDQELSSSSQSRDKTSSTSNSTNPFDDLVLKSGSESDSHTNRPQSQPSKGMNKQVSKSLSATYLHPDSNTVEQEQVVVSSTDRKETHLQTKASKHHSQPLVVQKQSKSKTDQDEIPVSGSVPSESRFKSYFNNFMGKGKKEEESPSGNRPSGHTRSRSHDFRVPPLPDAIRERSIDQKTKQHSKSNKEKQKGSSDTSSNGSHHSFKTDSEQHAASSGAERKSSGSGSGSGGGSRFSRFSVTSIGRSGKRSSAKHRSSSEADERKPFVSPVYPYKDDDPTYIHNNLTLYLDMNVFDTDKQERFELALKSPVIKYGDWNEIESFLVVSNRTAYLYRVTAPESLTPENWLELKATLSLRELVFIEIGIGYQSLRVEFDNPAQCYTFLIRNEDKCRKFFDKLSYVVSDVPKSNFKSVRISQFFLTYLRDPYRALRETLFKHYDQFHTSKTSPVIEELEQDESESEHLKLYLLAHKYNPNNDPSLVAVTFVLSNFHIFLALDNPQWPLPKLHPLPDRDDLLPPYSGVIKKEITDVEKLILYDDQHCQFTLQFFKESSTEIEPLSWTIVLKTSKGLQKFIKTLEELWSEQFQQTLHKEFR